MLRIVKCGDKSKLTELSLKQREMLTAYRQDKSYWDTKVTWREFIDETRQRPKPLELPIPRFEGA